MKGGWAVLLFSNGIKNGIWIICITGNPFFKDVLGEKSQLFSTTSNILASEQIPSKDTRNSQHCKGVGNVSFLCSSRLPISLCSLFFYSTSALCTTSPPTRTFSLYLELVSQASTCCGLPGLGQAPTVTFTPPPQGPDKNPEFWPKAQAYWIPVAGKCA